MKYNVGIIGYGFVGEAIAFAFSYVSNIFIYDILGQDFGVDMNVLKGAWKTNLTVRSEQDWEQLKGRSVNY